MFHNHVHIDSVHHHLTQSQVHSQENFQCYILYSTFPSLLPTAILSWSHLAYQAFWLAVWVMASAADLSHLSSKLYKRDNWVPNHTFPSFWMEVCSPILDSSFGGGFAMVASSFLSSMAK